MKKFCLRFIGLILVFVLFLPCFACNTDDNSSNGGNSKPIRPQVDFSDKVLVQNGTSNYKLVLPYDYNAREMFAANEFNTIFSLSTEIELPIVYDNEVNYSSSDEFISLGQTKFLQQFGVTPNYSQLSTQGYVIKRIDNCVIIAGATADGFGTIYGVYDFLARQIDYECYAEDEVYVKQLKNVNLIDVDLTDKPDVANCVRCGGVYENNREFQYRHRFVAHTDLFLGNMTMYHSSYTFLPPSKYLTAHPAWYWNTTLTSKPGEQGQICYTAHGNQTEYEAMVDTLFNVFKAEIEKTPNIVHIGFSINDNMDVCQCATCKERSAYFGNSYAALILNFLNDVSDKFDEYYRVRGEEKELDFMFFAYKATIEPPTKHLDEATCKDNVYPFICTFNANRVAAFTDKENASIRASIDGWAKVCKKMSFWTYSANYNNYIFPHDPFNCLQDNLKYIASKNPVYYKNEGVGDNYLTTGFHQLAYYLEYKLAWDTSLNMDLLIKDYFEHYFKDASDVMYDLFTRYRLALTRMYYEYNWTHYDNSNFLKRNLSFGELKLWQQYIEEAYKKIEYLQKADKETYDKLYKRIALESICVDYTIMYLYRDNFSEIEKQTIRDRLNYNCELTNLLWADDYGSRMVDVIDNLK